MAFDGFEAFADPDVSVLIDFRRLKLSGRTSRLIGWRATGLKGHDVQALRAAGPHGPHGNNRFSWGPFPARYDHRNEVFTPVGALTGSATPPLEN
jgi:hypothetical protein